jgi:hypothetical protein
MKRMFNNGRYANVTATLALVLAMGGTSYAAYSLPHNSVGSLQIRSAAVKNSDIGGSAVTTSKVHDGTLRYQDFAPGQLPAGPQGAAGPQGPAGQATAYAGVLANGALAPGSPSASKGFIPSYIGHVAGSGVYCIGGLDFQPANAIATVDDPGASSTVPFVVSVAVRYSTVPLAGCDPQHQQARVTITRVDPALPLAPADHGYSIWFE